MIRQSDSGKSKTPKETYSINYRFMNVYDMLLRRTGFPEPARERILPILLEDRELRAQVKNGQFWRMPEHLKTTELCWLAINKFPQQICYIPKKHLSPEICCQAIKGGVSIAHIPNEGKHPEVCELAVSMYLASFYHLTPEQRNTTKISMLAVSGGILSLRKVPHHNQTSEMCRIAVMRNGKELRYVAPHLQTPELCIMAIDKCPTAYRYVIEENMTPEVLHTIVKHNGWYIRYVPVEKRTAEMCKLAVEYDDNLLQFLSLEEKTDVITENFDKK